jgi:hypothetical protein
MTVDQTAAGWTSRAAGKSAPRKRKEKESGLVQGVVDKRGLGSSFKKDGAARHRQVVR